MPGSISILSVGAGDTTLRFDSSDPVEVERAKLVITDMLRRGYAILVQVGVQDGEPIYRRAKGFDPKTCEYVIAGVPNDEPALDVDLPENLQHGEEARPPSQKAKGAPRRPGARRKKGNLRIHASKTDAVAVGRIAGG
jgi:hypothetical protein